jgi:hypothetical protein
MKLDYALPASRVRIDSAVTIREDSLLGGDPVVSPQTTVTLEVGGGSRDQTLEINSGPFVNTAISLDLTEDGRLKSTELETVGEAGKVVLGVVGAATSIAAAVVAPPVVPLGLTTLVAKGRVAALTAGAPAAVPTPREREEAAFASESAEVAAMRGRYVSLVEKATRAVAGFSESLPFDTPEAIGESQLAQLKRLETVRARLQAELDHYNELFKAWRASKQSTRVENFQRALLIDTLRGIEIEEGDVPALDGLPADVRFAWTRLGVAVTVSPPAEEQAIPAPARNQVLVRIPRRTVLSVFEKGKDGRALLRESKRQLVMDSACEVVAVKLRRSVWAKRAVDIDFDDLGGLASFKQQTDSAAAAIAATAGEVPAKISGGVEDAVKLRKGLGELGSQGLAEELARVKQEAERKQQEITLAGLTATARDKAELERLKLQAEQLEQHRKIGESGALPAAATEQGSRKQQLEVEKLEAEIAKARG